MPTTVPTFTVVNMGGMRIIGIIMGSSGVMSPEHYPPLGALQNDGGGMGT
jgi:hypothetical protein